MSLADNLAKLKSRCVRLAKLIAMRGPREIVHKEGRLIRKAILGIIADYYHFSDAPLPEVVNGDIVRIRMKLAEEGIELTPIETAGRAAKVTQHIRQALIERGHYEFAAMDEADIYETIRRHHDADRRQVEGSGGEATGSD